MEAMSVRRRAIRARVERDRAFNESWAASGANLARLEAYILTCIADRDAHRRLDDDGAPAPEVPHDPYFDLVRATIEMKS